MTVTYYVPIYKWGSVNPDNVHGVTTATHFYSTLEDLYGFEPESVGHFEMTGTVPTENEFKLRYNLKSGAI
jgi:hypothetical protein